LDVEAVGAAVERDPRFVDAGLRRHQRDGPGRDVGGVGDQDCDATAQGRGQGVEQIAPIHLTCGVSAGATHGGWVDVGGVHLDPRHRGEQRGPHGTRAATQVEHHRARFGERDGVVGEELGAAARHEHPGVDLDPQATEFRPADQVFQRQPGGPLADQGVKFRECRGRGDQQPRLVLGEDTTGGTKPGDNDGEGAR